MNFRYYLRNVLDENRTDDVIKEKGLYQDIEDDLLKDFFAVAHHEINRLFKFLNSKLKNHHYNANESRDLIKWIKIIEDTIYVSKESETPIRIDERYAILFDECKSFLSESNGSMIPEDFEKIDIREYDPIFSLSDKIVLKNSVKSISALLHNIGEGSYAHVFKYNDEFYDKIFVLKRAKKELESKELERFKREFEIMKSLRSPYVIEVFCYQEKSNEYIMEYADQTILDYILKNNEKISLKERVNLVYQVLKGFNYIHSKGYLHRDISLTNVLLKKYDGLNVIKISDFGLVKTRESTLTSLGTELKGSLNDPSLQVIGFDKYCLIHEIYALTRLIFFIMTGKINLEGVKKNNETEFLSKGISEYTSRYQNLEELEAGFKEAFLLPE